MCVFFAYFANFFLFFFLFWCKSNATLKSIDAMYKFFLTINITFFLNILYIALEKVPRPRVINHFWRKVLGCYYRQKVSYRKIDCILNFVWAAWILNSCNSDLKFKKQFSSAKCCTITTVTWEGARLLTLRGLLFSDCFYFCYFLVVLDKFIWVIFEWFLSEFWASLKSFECLFNKIIVNLNIVNLSYSTIYHVRIIKI